MTKDERVAEVTSAILTDSRLLCIGPGWAALALPILMRADEEGVRVAQVKEKFGTLHIYLDDASNELYEACIVAERASARICEECGAPGEPCALGWVKTLCDEHYQERLKTRR